MKEIELVKLEEWYHKKIEDRFKKEHKAFQKLFQVAEKEIAETLNALKAWTDPNRKPPEGVAKLDDKNQKILARFVERLIEYIKEIKMPFVHMKMSYENVNIYCDLVKKLYQTYNETGRRDIHRFYENYKLEIKELELHLSKIGDITQKIASFLRSNYQEGKVAESLLQRIPKLISSIERLAQNKTQIENADKEFAAMQERMKSLEEKLYALGEDPSLKEFETLERQEQTTIFEFDEVLKFKKGFKKLQKLFEKQSQVRGMTESDIRPYLKNPIETIIQQGNKIPNLKEILLKLRILVEDEEDLLQLKGELKPKILSNINSIVNNNLLEPYITRIQEIRLKKETLKKILIEKGIENQRTDLKEKIAILTEEIEHFSNDLNRRKREYRDLIERVASDREELHKMIREQTGEDIKINIVVPS